MMSNEAYSDDNQEQVCNSSCDISAAIDLNSTRALERKLLIPARKGINTDLCDGVKNLYYYIDDSSSESDCFASDYEECNQDGDNLDLIRYNSYVYNVLKRNSYRSWKPLNGLYSEPHLLHLRCNAYSEYRRGKTSNADIYSSGFENIHDFSTPRSRRSLYISKKNISVRRISSSKKNKLKNTVEDSVSNKSNIRSYLKHKTANVIIDRNNAKDICNNNDSNLMNLEQNSGCDNSSDNDSMSLLGNKLYVNLSKSHNLSPVKISREKEMSPATSSLTSSKRKRDSSDNLECNDNNTNSNKRKKTDFTNSKRQLLIDDLLKNASVCKNNENNESDSSADVFVDRHNRRRNEKIKSVAFGKYAVEKNYDSNKKSCKTTPYNVSEDEGISSENRADLSSNDFSGLGTQEIDFGSPIIHDDLRKVRECDGSGSKSSSDLDDDDNLLKEKTVDSDKSFSIKNCSVSKKKLEDSTEKERSKSIVKTKSLSRPSLDISENEKNNKKTEKSSYKKHSMSSGKDNTVEEMNDVRKISRKGNSDSSDLSTHMSDSDSKEEETLNPNLKHSESFLRNSKINENKEHGKLVINQEKISSSSSDSDIGRSKDSDERRKNSPRSSELSTMKFLNKSIPSCNNRRRSSASSNDSDDQREKESVRNLDRRKSASESSDSQKNLIRDKGKTSSSRSGSRSSNSSVDERRKDRSTNSNNCYENKNLKKLSLCDRRSSLDNSDDERMIEKSRNSSNKNELLTYNDNRNSHRLRPSSKERSEDGDNCKSKNTPRSLLNNSDMNTSSLSKRNNCKDSTLLQTPSFMKSLKSKPSSTPFFKNKTASKDTISSSDERGSSNKSCDTDEESNVNGEVDRFKTHVLPEALRNIETKLVEGIRSEQFEEDLLFIEDFSDNDEVWVAQCPKSLKVESLLGTKFDLSGRTTLSAATKDGKNNIPFEAFSTFLSAENNVSSNATMSNVYCLMPSRRQRRLKLRAIETKGTIKIEERISVPTPNTIKFTSSTELVLPENLRIRHPLLGSDFSEQYKALEYLNKSSRLSASGLKHDSVKENSFKKSKKRKRSHSTSSTGGVETAIESGDYSSLFNNFFNVPKEDSPNKRHKKKKRKRDNDEEVDNSAKVDEKIINDACTRQAYDEEISYNDDYGNHSTSSSKKKKKKKKKKKEHDESAISDEDNLFNADDINKDTEEKEEIQEADRESEECAVKKKKKKKKHKRACYDE